MGKIMLNNIAYAGASGGLAGKELTQAEYDALPEEEKKTGLYFITDGIATKGDTYTFTSSYLDFDIYKRGDIACVRKYGEIKKSIPSGAITTIGTITDEKFIPSDAQYMLVPWRDTTSSASTAHSFMLTIDTNGVVSFANVDSVITGNVIFNTEYYLKSSTDENLIYTFTSDYVDMTFTKRDNVVFVLKYGAFKKGISTGSTVVIGTITDEAFIPKSNQYMLVIWKDGSNYTSAMHSFILTIYTSGKVEFGNVDYAISTSASVMFNTEYIV